jgi:hypothetical protein
LAGKSRQAQQGHGQRDLELLRIGDAAASWRLPSASNPSCVHWPRSEKEKLVPEEDSGEPDITARHLRNVG